VYFDGEVNDASMAALALAIDSEVARGRKDVFLVLNSPGGTVSAGLDFIFAVEKYKQAKHITFTCAVDGMAASTAAVIFEAVCDQRLMTKRSLLLFHGARMGQAGGTQEQMEEAVETIRVLNEIMAALVAPRLGMTEPEFLERIHGRDWLLSWRDAEKRKAIDGVIEPAQLPRF
jgi:ATP-dependent protease ClpP protease subunit